MKKTHLLTLAVALLMAATATAATELAGIYRLSNLTTEQKEALGTISADAAIRILPGDDAADYYLSGVAGYGCKFATTYDAAAGTLKAVDQGPYGFMTMILYFGDLNVVVVDETSIVFNVKADGTLELASEALVTGMFTDEIYGDYIPGMTFTKAETPAITASDIAGKYTFTATSVVNFATMDSEEITTSIEIKQTEGNTLSIDGFMGVDGIQATYIPEVAMLQIATQEIDDKVVSQTYGDIFFTVSAGELELISPAMLAPKDAVEPLVSYANGKGVKEITDAIERTTTAKAAKTVAVRNGAIHIDSAEPVSVEVYNAAGVRVYADTVSGTIALPRGIYFVKAGKDAKAVAVAL